MKNKIFMYLFIFTALLVLFMYMNQKKIYEDQQENIEKLKVKVEDLTADTQVMQTENADLNYFTLQGNDNAMTYFEDSGLDAANMEKMITRQLYDQNTSAGNPLVPYEGMEGVMQINKVRFLNHKWIIADFTDGQYWGEMLIQYDLDEENELTLNTLSSFLYSK